MGATAHGAICTITHLKNSNLNKLFVIGWFPQQKITHLAYIVAV